MLRGIPSERTSELAYLAIFFLNPLVPNREVSYTKENG